MHKIRAGLPAPHEVIEGGVAPERSERGDVEILSRFLATIAEQLSGRKALGVLLFDASFLGRIEALYGIGTRRLTSEKLCDWLRDQIASLLGPDDRLLGGSLGGHELATLFFRDSDDAEFFQEELPGLRLRVADAFERRGRRIAHPYLTGRLGARVGSSVLLRNPTVGLDTQLRRALGEARENADLHARIEAERRRRELIEILLKGRIRSVYEPIVEVKTRTVFGYEALARGPRESSLYSPIDLFSVAEEADLLFQLDCLCRRSGLIGAQGLPDGTKLFLNVRPTAIHDPDFREQTLRHTLESCGLAPDDVVLEISEQESIENFEIFREIRDTYRKLGFQIALDDTGSGYASLEAVVELAPDFIKVDRAFVRGVDEDPARQELLNALQKLAERLGSQIIGEGLDTWEELETLARLGIRYGQGWLFGEANPLRSDLAEP